ncbi:hypothetical protein [Flavobacterium orientale]|jgi:hypothetical protein|uniref:Uncharacterized protein n=1 Tax=Flavobacterium orientale TaxID=1756020 RepID=A0A916Y6B5_9FLAO|nr:hypothetical protein [Flavobacterium orientale]GGD32221.1 hypothetical protein GCM10011343_22860 [Flavobacterium orientale]
MNWSYLFKHWFFTLLLGPVVSQIVMYVIDVSPGKIVGLLEVYPLSLLFGLFFSTPTYILYGLVYYFLARNNINLNLSKVILISLAVVGVITTTSIIKGSMMLDITISYSIASVITGLFFKLKFN